MNFDAAIGNDASLGVRVAIRDDKGQVLALFSSRKRGTTDSFFSDSMAAREAMIFARDTGMQDVVLEGDSSLVITLMQKRMKR